VRQPVSHARIHVEASDLKIDHCIEIVLLLIEGQPVLRSSEVGIILKPDGEILTEITRETGSRGKIRTTILSNPKVDDRVDDEFVVGDQHPSECMAVPQRRTLREAA
jgi:hypothetical protein